MNTDDVIDEMELDDYYAADSGDPAKRDLELMCRKCESRICDIESGDTLGVLIRTAKAHICEQSSEDE